MEVFIRDEDKKYAVVDKSQFEPYSFLLESYDKIKVKSLDQHDAETRADERKKVCEELEKYIKEISYETTASVGGFDYSAVDFEDLQQKLAELKGE